MRTHRSNICPYMTDSQVILTTWESHVHFRLRRKWAYVIKMHVNMCKLLLSNFIHATHG